MISYDKIFNGLVKMKEIKEAIIYVEDSSGEFSYKSFYGDKELSSPFVISGVTKLYTTACILKAVSEKKILLTERISKYLGDQVNKLCVYKGVDYSETITIENLLFQTSGLPDYFETSIKARTAKEDLTYSFSECLEWTKKMKAVAKPGDIAYYSDINFDILGYILEKALNKPLVKIYKEYIIEPLGLKVTYLPLDVTQIIPNIFYNDKYLARPKSIISRGASGGIITNAKELMIFMKAFHKGELFNKALLDLLKVYRPLQPSIMAPANYGGGFMQFVVPKVVNENYTGKGELLGQASTTGAFAFYCPQHDLFMVGDINQMGNPGLAKKIAILMATGS